MEWSPVSHINRILYYNNTNNFFTEYQNINNKLKKRFMRNPNIAEASEQFISLAVQCEHEEAWQYVGLCYLATSRCYYTLGNIGSQLHYLITAGKYFLNLNKQNKNVGCPSIGLADLQGASSCSNEVVKCCEDKSIYNVRIAGSKAILACALGSTSAGEQVIRKTINIYPTIQFINILISYCLKQDDYATGLNIATDLINHIETIVTTSEYYRKCLHKTEVSRLMLMLMAQQRSQRLLSPHAEIIEKYTMTNGDSTFGGNIGEDEFLALQSLIFACQCHDREALLKLEGELWKYMDTSQKDFLRSLIQIAIGE